MSERTTNKYELRRGNKVVYVGITTDMAQREQQHRASGKDFTSMVKVGNITTPEAASRWEAERIQTYKVHHGGARPEYALITEQGIANISQSQLRHWVEERL